MSSIKIKGVGTGSADLELVAPVTNVARTLTLPDATGTLLTLDGDGSALQNIDALPSQTGHAGKYLTTDAADPSWVTLATDYNTTTKGLYEMSYTIAANYTITTGSNAYSVGPITINAGISTTIPSGSTWVIA